MRPFLLVFGTVLLQGLFSGLLPDFLAPPDLMFLLALGLVAPLPPMGGLLIAFGIGLLQDLLSAGFLGLHALGLLLAAYLFHWLTRVLRWEEPLGRTVVLLGCFAAKWLGYLVVSYWLRSEPFGVQAVLGIFVSELALTLVVAGYFLQLAEQVVGGRRLE